MYELSIEDEADQLRVALIYERFGFREDRYYLCTYMLVIIGLFWRLLALVLLVSEVSTGHLQNSCTFCLLTLIPYMKLFGVKRVHGVFPASQPGFIGGMDARPY